MAPRAANQFSPYVERSKRRARTQLALIWITAVPAVFGTVGAAAQTNSTTTTPGQPVAALQGLTTAQMEMIKPLLQQAPVPPGGEIHGFVSASLPSGVTLKDDALPNARVAVQTPGGEIESSATQTSSIGRFRILRQDPGTYNVCASLQGFVTNCSAVQVPNQNVAMLQPITLQPVGGSVAGCVTLKNGAPAIRTGGPYATAASATVAVKNGAGRVVAGPAPVNGAGCYVIPNVPSEDGLSVDVQYEQAQAVQALDASPPHAAVNIILPTYPPSIASFTATLDGKVVSEAAPGSTVNVEVKATSPENYPLHYTWADSTGTPLPGDQPTQPWPLPRTSSLNFIYVEVADSHGGATRASLSLATAPIATTSAAPAEAVPSLERFIIINPTGPVTGPTGPINLPPPYPAPLAIFQNNNGDLFLDPGLFMGGCAPGTELGCDAEAKKYYQAIGVFDSNNKAKGSFVNFKTWKASWGFSDDPTTPLNTELRAVYYNNADLQFGRDMHCLPIKTTTSTEFGSSEVTACYVANYSDSGGPGSQHQGTAITYAEQNHLPIAAVAMVGVNSRQFGLGLNGNVSSSDTSSVYFVVFTPPLAASNIGEFTPSIKANLDSQGPKVVPGICMACHGGNYNAATSSVSNARFLPFDTPSFLYDEVLLAFTESAQSETFRQLNSVVRAVDAGVTDSSKVTSQTSTDLIDGWYSWCGGVGKSGCSIDDVGHPFIPSVACISDKEPATCGWGGATDLVRGPAYQQGPRVDCRTCHITHSDSFNWQNYQAFVTQVQTVKKGDTVENVCRFLENYYMPLSQVAYDRFWGSTIEQNTFEYLINTVPPGKGQGPCDVTRHVPPRASGQ
jgi:hypothetical protein